LCEGVRGWREELAHTTLTIGMTLIGGHGDRIIKDKTTDPDPPMIPAATPLTNLDPIPPPAPPLSSTLPAPSASGAGPFDPGSSSPSPAPEPASLFSSILGIALLSLARRRRTA
jgi:hypothetical protein